MEGGLGFRAKARFLSVDIAARLKPCPDTKPIRPFQAHVRLRIFERVVHEAASPARMKMGLKGGLGFRG